MNYFQTGGDLFQWDIGRKVTLALPDGEIASVVEFTINNEANALVVDVKGNEAEIPNILLQTAGGLRMWAVTVTADGRQTRRYGSAPVYARAKPDDYIYTETEVKRYEELAERIRALEENGVGGGGGAVESVNGKTGEVTLKAEDVGAIPNEDGAIQSNHLGSMVVKNANIAYGAVSDSRIAEKTITFQRLSNACVEDIKGLQYTAQQPTSAQQQVARDNIAAASQKDVERLTEEKVSSVNGFHPDSNGAVTIKYDRTTEKTYRHSGLSEYPKKITVYANDAYTVAPYIFMGKNYWPATEQIVYEYTKHGLTLSTDKHSITIKGTATTGAYFPLSPDGATEYWEIPSDIVAGDQFLLYVFGKASDRYSFFAKVRVYDANKNYIRQVQSALDVGKTFYKSAAFEIPENAKYFTFHLAYSNGNTYDHTMFPVFVKAGTEVINDTAFAEGVAECNTDNQTRDICSAPYECVVGYAQDLKEYIDYGANSVSFDLTTIHNDMSYVSPEMFGAYADGKHDDTAPIQACVDYAILNKKKVLGGNAYITNSSIIVDGNYHNIELGEIFYSGTDSAVIVRGSYNNIRIGNIYADYGTCIRLVSDKQTIHNNMVFGYMRSQKNSVEYLRTTNNLFGNRLQFEYIKAGAGYSCIYQSPEILTDGNPNLNLNNNNFVGGQLAGGEWGVYGAKGTDTYLTVQFEGVNNGIYMDGVGTCRVISPRYAELVQLAYASGTLSPVEGKGALFAVESSFGATLPHGISKTMEVQIWPPNTQISPFNVDVSKAPIDVVDNGETVPLPKIYPGAYTVGEKLRHRNGNVYADSFMIYGRHILIEKPLFNMRKTVNVSDTGYAGDYRITGDEANEFSIYSRFIIAASGCVYTLPPSYDLLAFNEFVVDQPEGTSCTFRDWRGTVIFDGVQYGTGTYKVVARIKDGVMWDYYDNRNQVWDVYRNGELVATMPQAD